MKLLINSLLVISLIIFSGCTQQASEAIAKRNELREKKEKLEKEVSEAKALLIERDQARAELNYIEAQIEQIESILPPKEDQK